MPAFTDQPKDKLLSQRALATRSLLRANAQPEGQERDEALREHFATFPLPSRGLCRI